GLPLASSTIEIAPVRAPAAVGVKVTAIEHEAPTATVDPQLLTAVKSPLGLIAVMASAPVPTLVNETNCGGDVVAMVCVPKATVPGNNASPEPAAIGVTAFGATRPAALADVAAADRAVVVTVSVERTALRPGVTVGGSNVHVVCGGRLPLEQFKVISVL